MVVRGNHDHSVAFDEDPRCSARFRSMADETGRYTRSVPQRRGPQVPPQSPADGDHYGGSNPGPECHAAPSSPLFEYRSEDSPRWLDDPVGPGVNVVGHTHVPFERSLGLRLIVNPGSVGQPKHGRAEACFALWHDGRIALSSAQYDAEQTIEKLRTLSFSTGVFQDLAFVLRNGRVPPSFEISSD